MRCAILNWYLIGLLGCAGAGLVPTGEDAREAYAVHAFIDEEFDLPGTMYAGPGVRASTIEIYGVTDRGEQDRVIEAVEEERARHSWKPVVVVFKDREVLRSSKDGSVTTRGHEPILRRQVID